MVLIRLAPALLVLAACNQSLFSNGDNGGGGDAGGNGGDGGGSGDGDIVVPTSCTAPCIADAGGDFDGSPGGSNGRWRYLEDNRDRTWTPMTSNTPGFIGVDPANKIVPCSAQSGNAGCSALPGALLLSSAGGGAPADPAIELTIPSPNQVVRLSLRVRSATNQAVRLYRNSREDVLFAGVASAGTTLEHAITIDALAGERILFALTPGASGAEAVAVQLFVSESGDTFPQHCQVALRFEQSPTETVAPNECGQGFTHYDYQSDVETPPVIVPGPFAELGSGSDLPNDRYYKGAEVLARPGDFTVQFWVQSDVVDPVYGGFVFSDYDLNAGGGLGFVIFDDAATKGEIGTCTNPDSVPLEFNVAAASYPMDHAWHFIRIAYTAGMASLCIDGRKATSFAAPAGSLVSTYVPYLGRNVVWTPAVAEFDGKIDDLRVFSVALPCE